MRNSYKVVGVTKVNDEGQDIQDILEETRDNYADEGVAYIKDVVRLEKEPTNPYDRDAIKVYLKDIDGIEHHVGYIARDKTREVAEEMEILRRADAEFTGGDGLNTGLVIHLVDITDGNPYLMRADEMNTKQKKIDSVLRKALGAALVFAVVVYILIAIAG